MATAIRDLARTVRDGRLFVAPGAGHDLTNEQPDLCRTAMLGFYRSIDAIPEGPP